jgi:hypothetical protein
VKKLPPLGQISEIEVFEKSSDHPAAYWLDIRFEGHTNSPLPCGVALISRYSRSKHSEN